MQGQQLRPVQIHRHPAQLGLGQLERPDRLTELLAGPRVLDRALQAGPRRAGDAPGDAVAGLGQARQGALQPGYAGEYGIGGEADLIEVQFGRVGDWPLGAALAVSSMAAVGALATLAVKAARLATARIR